MSVSFVANGHPYWAFKSLQTSPQELDMMGRGILPIADLLHAYQDSKELGCQGESFEAQGLGSANTKEKQKPRPLSMEILLKKIEAECTGCRFT